MLNNKEDNLKPNKSTQFTSDKQPTSKAKSLGHKKKSLLKTISGQLVSGDSKEALNELAKYLGVKVDEIDIETAMHLKQMEKALKEGDTRAYNAVMDRIKGKPNQMVSVLSVDVKPIKTVRDV